MKPLLFVAESESEQRLGERLARLGVPLEVVSGAQLAAARQGECYLVTAERAASSQPETITSTGAHLCVIPPWPDSGLSLKHSRIAPVATARRDPIQLDLALAGISSASDQANRQLIITYREYLPGLAGKALGVSLSGETVLLAWPRVSNLHGHLLVTTLLVSQPSTQTVAEDVVRLFQLLASWLETYTDRHASQERPAQAISLFDPEAERHAQLVLLALALSQTEHHTSGDLPLSTPVSMTAMQLHAERIADILGLSLSPASFQHGWQTLAGMGILLSSGPETRDQQQEGMLVNWTKAAERINTWQLGPRLRRLRQRVSSEGDLRQDKQGYSAGERERNKGV